MSQKNPDLYLYGADVVGIQMYILKSSRLCNIIEASAMVEWICTEAFAKYTEPNKGNIVVQAAGKIRCVFNDRACCEAAVRNFPREIMSCAPGIILNQAVVPYSESDYASAANSLEQRLKIQRNKPAKSMTTGLMGIRRQRETGELSQGPKEGTGGATYYNENLCEKAFGEFDRDITTLTSELAGTDSWVAVIHADGNGLGEVVASIKDSQTMNEFSNNLSKATTVAAQDAYGKVQNLFGDSKIIPIRPVVLNGDDLTIICRADLALPYVTSFCAKFEEVSKECCTESTGREHLTACAGIAFIKAKYPYYYAYELAESLCAYAKKEARTVDEKNKPSCVLFHKVSDSFSEDYPHIIERELNLPNGKTWLFGPYYLKEKEDRWTLAELQEKVESLKKNSPLWNALRQWAALMCRDQGEYVGRAELLRQDIRRKFPEAEQFTTPIDSRYPTYDILAVAAMESGTLSEEKVQSNNSKQ